MIALFYNCWSNPTGAATFTEHLKSMLINLGEEVSIYRIREKNYPRAKPIHKFGGSFVTDISIETAIEIARNNPSLMTHFIRGNKEAKLCQDFVAATGCPFVIHDPRGLVNEMLTAASKSGAKAVFIRSAMQKLFKQKTNNTVSSVFIKHPYIRQSEYDRSYNKKHNAVAVARIAREKNTHIICEANQFLSPEKSIDIFGAISDRLYSYFNLDKKFPAWRERYFGEQQINNVDTYTLCKNSNFAIDMSTFKGEGGGTQYTFLEAMDAGCCLVLHSNWVTYEGGMENWKNCLVASNAKELANIVSNSPVKLPGYEELLAEHSTEILGKQWLNICYEH